MCASTQKQSIKEGQLLELDFVRREGMRERR
jgi:hypothetical protein